MSDRNNASEVVIVGGGIYGTSLAYQLAQAGKSVTLLEAGELAGGASGGPGERGVRANGRDLRELPVCAIAQKLWGTYQEKFEGGVGFRRLGGLQIYDIPYGHREHEVLGRMAANAEAQSRLGTPSVVLTREQALAREPELASGVFGAIYCPNDGVGDHAYATQQFAKEAAKAGVTIRTSAKVVEIVHAKSAATGVKLASGEIVPVGDQLVIVANAGAEALLNPVMKPHEVGPIWNLIPQMHYVSNPLNKTVNHLLSHAHRRLAVKQLPDGVLMLSGGAHVAHTPEGIWKGSLSAMTQNVVHERHCAEDPDRRENCAEQAPLIAVEMLAEQQRHAGAQHAARGGDSDEFNERKVDVFHDSSAGIRGKNGSHEGRRMDALARTFHSPSRIVELLKR